MIKKIAFSPDKVLNIGDAASDFSIKGVVPKHTYFFTLLDVYSTVPSLRPYAAYIRISAELESCATVLSRAPRGALPIALPKVEDDAQAIFVLKSLFNPSNEMIVVPDRIIAAPDGAVAPLFEIPMAMPFPLVRASQDKLVHTLFWIDANMKISMEAIADLAGLQHAGLERCTEAAFVIYSLLIKQQDYVLARTINFNHSMFIQDRIMQLIGGALAVPTAQATHERAHLANAISLRYLKGMGNISSGQLCTLGVFMGIIWTSDPEMQQAFRQRADATLGDIESRLGELTSRWAINDQDLFMRDIAGCTAADEVVVVLDDNGESVFDLALFQRLLNDQPALRVVFIVNRFPISNNISLDTLNELLGDAYFADLRRHLQNGHAGIIVESQAFRSFEVSHLSAAARERIRCSRMVYIKGANFFETMQMPGNVRYHSFTVYGMTSRMLAGSEEESGIFVRLDPEDAGYRYDSPEMIETLTHIIKRKRNGPRGS
jgi:hypothetical protein